MFENAQLRFFFSKKRNIFLTPVPKRLSVVLHILLNVLWTSRSVKQNKADLVIYLLVVWLDRNFWKELLLLSLLFWNIMHLFAAICIGITILLDTIMILILTSAMLTNLPISSESRLPTFSDRQSKQMYLHATHLSNQYLTLLCYSLLFSDCFARKQLQNSSF